MITESFNNPTPQPGRRIRFGVNYVPSKRWYYCWNDWDAASIAEDFEAIAKLGADHIRVMLIWPWFQPNPKIVSPAHLQRLEELLKLAGERGLDVFVCPLNGWLSGYRFFPPEIDSLQIFQSEEVFEQIKLYFGAVLDVSLKFGNFAGLDLGNELNVLAPFLPPAEGDAWATRLTAWLRPLVQGRWLVNGVDHHPWFTGRTFSTTHLVEEYDAVTIHAWPLFTSCLAKGGLADLPSQHLAAFMTQVCRHGLAQAGLEKPIWIQEFGCSPLWGSPEEMTLYMHQSIGHAVDAGATWFTWWCSHDISAEYGFTPLEYHLGLLTTANEPKPLGREFSEIVRKYGEGGSLSAKRYLLPSDFKPQITQQAEPDDWERQNLLTTTWEAFEKYLEKPPGLSGVTQIN